MSNQETISCELLEAARQVLWKLNHNHDDRGYRGPARITREDATVRMLQAAYNKAINAETGK
jgi:hypothetical protein